MTEYTFSYYTKKDTYSLSYKNRFLKFLKIGAKVKRTQEWIRKSVKIETEDPDQEYWQFLINLTRTLEEYSAHSFQAEEGAYPTSFIPTKEYTVTRASDEVNVTSDGTLLKDIPMYFEFQRTNLIINQPGPEAP